MKICWRCGKELETPRESERGVCTACDYKDSRGNNKSKSNIFSNSFKRRLDWV